MAMPSTSNNGALVTISWTSPFTNGDEIEAY